MISSSSYSSFHCCGSWQHTCHAGHVWLFFGGNKAVKVSMLRILPGLPSSGFCRPFMPRILGILFGQKMKREACQQKHNFSPSGFPEKAEETEAVSIPSHIYSCSMSFLACGDDTISKLRSMTVTLCYLRCWLNSL